MAVVSHHPSDIIRLKKSVPLSPAECITFVAANNVRKDSGEIRTFAAVAATLLTLGNADASIASRSLNRSVRTDKIEQSEKRPKNERYCVSSETLLHLKRNATAFDFGGCSDPPTKDDDTAAAG